MRKIKCNICGKSFDFWDENENFSIRKWMGYGTRFDGDYLDLDICCGCMEKLIDQCKISPVRPPEVFEV